MSGRKRKPETGDYYDQEARGYIRQYRGDYKGYPANSIRLGIILERLKKNNVKKILDVGCGTCGPMIKLLREGFAVKGFDFSKEMVRQGRKELEQAGYSPGLIYYADLENGRSLQKDKFDAVLALGVFPHIRNEKKALSNMRRLLNAKGLVFVEFRNDLFAAYTLNEYSVEFFLNKVIGSDSLPKHVRDDVVKFFSQRLKADRPRRQKGGKIAYADIPAQFRNPLTIERELLSPCNFGLKEIHFYHYHALPPIFENKYPGLFRQLSLKLEKTGDWRGYLMASAYVVEAKKEG